MQFFVSSMVQGPPSAAFPSAHGRMRKVDPQLQAVRAAAQQRFLAQKAQGAAAPQAAAGAYALTM